MSRFLLSFSFGLLCLLFSGARAQTKILFDATKAETAGSANWVVDADLHNLNWRSNSTVTTGGTKANAQRLVTPDQSTVTATTDESIWEGSISAWGMDLVKKGYYIETLPYNGKITYGNTSNPQDLSNYKVFVVCEPNIYFTSVEKTAMLNFVANGGGLFIISDHAGSDRNNDGSDSPKIWDDFFENNGTKFNPFGISFDTSNPNGGVYPSDFSETSSKVIATVNPISQGVFGKVAKMRFGGGTAITLDTNANKTVVGVIFSRNSTGALKGAMCAYAKYGKGKIVAIGDSTPASDGTGDPNSNLYVSYFNDPTLGDNHRNFFMNASIWLATSSLPISFVDVQGALNDNYATISWQANIDGAYNSFFEIEKSLDGEKFVTIGKKTIGTIGNAAFSYTDNAISEGMSYYRIAYVENGNKTFSKTIALSKLTTNAIVVSRILP